MHNPRPVYLKRVLQALRQQTLPRDQWELLLIDNASASPLAAAWDIGWHSYARHLREDELGLTPTRLRGIRESNADLIIFVDDDNVLATDYLERATEVAAGYPLIGAFCGSIIGEFEVAPSQRVKKYAPWLAIEEIQRDFWANIDDTTIAVPVGAGLCVRRSVAEHYAQQLSLNEGRRSLDRIGKALGGFGDIDLALTATDLQTGRFQAMKLTHLISAGRVDEDYIVRIVSESWGSRLMFEAARGRLRKEESKLVNLLKFVAMWSLSNSLDRRIRAASRKAEMRVRRELDGAKTELRRRAASPLRSDAASQ